MQHEKGRGIEITHISVSARAHTRTLRHAGILSHARRSLQHTALTAKVTCWTAGRQWTALQHLPWQTAGPEGWLGLPHYSGKAGADERMGSLAKVRGS